MKFSMCFRNEKERISKVSKPMSTPPQFNMNQTEFFLICSVIHSGRFCVCYCCMLHFIVMHFTLVTVLHFSVLYITVLHLTELHFTVLHFTELHFTVQSKNNYFCLVQARVGRVITGATLKISRGNSTNTMTHK